MLKKGKKGNKKYFCNYLPQLDDLHYVSSSKYLIGKFTDIDIFRTDLHAEFTSPMDSQSEIIFKGFLASVFLGC